MQINCFGPEGKTGISITGKPGRRMTPDITRNASGFAGCNKRVDMVPPAGGSGRVPVPCSANPVSPREGTGGVT